MLPHLRDKNPDEYKWAGIYDHLQAKPYGYLAVYEELTRVAGFSITEDRGPIYAVIRELERNDKRTLANEIGIGYRIAHPTEHISLAYNRKKKANRQIRKAVRTLTSAPMRLLSDEDRLKHSNLQVYLGRVQQWTNKRPIQRRRTSEQPAISNAAIADAEARNSRARP